MLHYKEKYAGQLLNPVVAQAETNWLLQSQPLDICYNPCPSKMPRDPELKWSTTDLLTDVKCPVDSSVVGLSVRVPTLRPVAGVKGYMFPAAVETIL